MTGILLLAVPMLLVLGVALVALRLFGDDED